MKDNSKGEDKEQDDIGCNENTSDFSSFAQVVVIQVSFIACY